MIRPAFFSFMVGITALQKNTSPIKLMPKILSQSALVYSTKGFFRDRMPALLTSTSTVPNRSSTFCTAVLTCSSWETSHCPASSSAAATAASWLMSTMATRIPSFTSRAAMALPMPWAAPVTIAALLISAMRISFFYHCAQSRSPGQRDSPRRSPPSKAGTGNRDWNGLKTAPDRSSAPAPRPEGRSCWPSGGPAR
jgi:hypothetical protein